MPFNSGFWQINKVGVKGQNSKVVTFMQVLWDLAAQAPQEHVRGFVTAQQPASQTHIHHDIESDHDTESDHDIQSNHDIESVHDTESDHDIQSDHETESDHDTDSVTCFQDFWGGFLNIVFYKKLDVNI